MDVIVIDICNTLADVNSVLENIFGKRPKGIYRFPEATEEFFLNNLWVFAEAKAYRGAAAALRRLASTYGIVYLTARPEVSDLITRDWLKDGMFPDGPVVYRTDKVVVARELGAVRAIEDSPEEISNYELAGIPVMVHKQDYNSGYGNRFEWSHFRTLKGW